MRAEQLATELANSATTIEELNGLMRLMMRSGLERMLNTEMDVHLGRKGIATQELTNTPTPLAGNWQETDGTQWLDLASVDTTLCTIIEAWDSLPKHIRDAIYTLCDAQRTG